MTNGTFLNADNEDLGGFPGLAIPDEVRGHGAEELPLMPTRHELLVLVKHWGPLLLGHALHEFIVFRVRDEPATGLVREKLLLRRSPAFQLAGRSAAARARKTFCTHAEA